MSNTDRGSHFKNTVMAALNKALHSRHQFTTPYCPQSNGTVETVCKELLLAIRSLLSEFRMDEKHWPLLLRLVQSILNDLKHPSLGNVALTAFSGLPGDNLLRTIIDPDSANQASSLDFIRAQKIMKIEALSKALDSMHKEVAISRARRPENAVKVHNAKTHVQKINFEVGDFVLVAQREKKDGHKLRVKWRGPYRVLKAESEFVFTVENLITHDAQSVHANRLKLYADSSLEMTETSLDPSAYINPHFNTVEKLLDLHFNEDLSRYEIETQWRGFEYEDPTWEPLTILKEDIPKMLNVFLENFHNQELVAEATAN